MYGGRSGGGFPIVGSIDANGCDSWTYEHAGSFGPYTSFFAGSGFQAGQHAYQDSTQETTELLDGHQLIRVVDPTQQWLRVYQGYDVCTTGTGPNGSTMTCIAPAPESLPDDWVIYIPVAILLGLMALFLIHFLRPAGPVRRPRHYRRVHQDLTHATPRDSADPARGRRYPATAEASASAGTDSELRALGVPAPLVQRARCIGQARHGPGVLGALDGRVPRPIPDHAREEALWLASSLKIEREVRPVLDAQVFAHRTTTAHAPHPPPGSTSRSTSSSSWCPRPSTRCRLLSARP